jgi:DNA-binding Lrp family transcriptional regulator
MYSSMAAPSSSGRSSRHFRLVESPPTPIFTMTLYEHMFVVSRALRSVKRGERIPFVVTAVVLIEAERSAIAKLGPALADVPGVAEAYSVTGEFDFVVIVRVKNHEEIADVVTSRLSQVPGIIKTHTHVAFKVYSKHDLEAMFSVGLQEAR